jgi:hypothetical protein
MLWERRQARRLLGSIKVTIDIAQTSDAELASQPAKAAPVVYVDHSMRGDEGTVVRSNSAIQAFEDDGEAKLRAIEQAMGVARVK